MCSHWSLAPKKQNQTNKKTQLQQEYTAPPFWLSTDSSFDPQKAEEDQGWINF
jgi:hypothetical protein